MNISIKSTLHQLIQNFILFLILTLSGVNAVAQVGHDKFSPELFALLNQISQNDSVHFIAGPFNGDYQNNEDFLYDSIFRIASEVDLLHLCKNENPKIRVVALLGLHERNSASFDSVYLEMLLDSSFIKPIYHGGVVRSVIYGEWKGSPIGTTLYSAFSKPEFYRRKLLTDQSTRRINNLIIYSDGHSQYYDAALENISLTESDYPRIKELSYHHNNALIRLAEYKNPIDSNHIIINSKKLTNKEFIQLVTAWPLKSYCDTITTLSKLYPCNHDLVLSIAAYKNQFSKQLIDSMIPKCVSRTKYNHRYHYYTLKSLDSIHYPGSLEHISMLWKYGVISEGSALRMIEENNDPSNDLFFQLFEDTCKIEYYSDAIFDEDDRKSLCTVLNHIIQIDIDRSTEIIRLNLYQQHAHAFMTFAFVAADLQNPVFIEPLFDALYNTDAYYWVREYAFCALAAYNKPEIDRKLNKFLINNLGQVPEELHLINWRKDFD